MRRTTPLTSLLLAVVLALGLAATASAASPDEIIRDCTNSETGRLTGTYTKGELRRAAKRVTGDIAEYTGCYDAIRFALKARPSANAGRGASTGTGGDPNGGTDLGGGTGGGVGGSNGSGGFDGGGAGGPVDPEDEVVVAGGGPPSSAPPTPQAGSDRPVEVAGTTIRPGSVPAVGHEANALPGAMTALLVLLGAGALGAVATTIGRRVLARRRA